MKVCLFIFFLLGFHIYAQAQISGKAFVEKDRSPIRGASVMLRNFQTKKILTYTQTDAQGKFSLKKKLDKGVYLIEIRHLSYETFSQSIVVSDSIAAAVHLSAAMKLRQNKLKEVVVKPKTRPPIIVKKDTTIYDIKHWLRESDETLEDVLKKMDGIEISPDGEITVDGQRVKKVLIDGKEVSDVGAAVITKSIDPESVKNIEVRFDEKDDKIKESLLDANEYVVLDIKLKEGFNKRFFGKLRPTLGYQHDLQYGGYANLFSLNNWGNLHLFAEHDNFGTQTLSMTNLKNIGKDAFRRRFEVPDYLKSVEIHQNLSTGRGYQFFDRAIIGLTTKFNLTDNLSLFIGSYNSLEFKESLRNVEQFFESGATSTFTSNTQLNQPISKNKLEIKYDRKNTKINFDVNLEYGKPEETYINRLDPTVGARLRYDFSNDKEYTGLYNHLLFEQKISSTWGVEFKAAHAFVQHRDRVSFDHNNAIFAEVLKDDKDERVYRFIQDQSPVYRQLNLQPRAQYKSVVGDINLSALYERIDLNFEAETKNKESNAQLKGFTQKNSLYHYQNIKPFINHRLQFGSITLFNEVGYSFVDYPNSDLETTKARVWDYYVKLNYTKGTLSWHTSYSKRLPSFPMHKTLRVNTLLNFQMIESPASNITPQREEAIDIMLTKRFVSAKLNLAVFAKTARTPLQDNFLVLRPPFMDKQRAQFDLRNYLFGFSMISLYFPIHLTLTPAMSIFESTNQTVDKQEYQTITRASEVAFRAYASSNEIFNLITSATYNRYDFENTLSGDQSRQETIQLNFDTQYPLIEKVFFIDIDFDNTFFLEKERSQVSNLDVKLRCKQGSLTAFVLVGNLFNHSGIIQKNVYPTYFNIQTQALFARYVKLGVSYKFK